MLLHQLTCIQATSIWVSSLLQASVHHAWLTSSIPDLVQPCVHGANTRLPILQADDLKRTPPLKPEPCTKNLDISLEGGVC